MVQTKPKGKTKLSPNMDAENQADAHCGEGTSTGTDTGQMVGSNRNHEELETGQPSPSPTTGSSLEDTPIILRRDENVPLLNRMEQEMASASTRGLFHQQASAHVTFMNAGSNTNSTIPAITM